MHAFVGIWLSVGCLGALQSGPDRMDELFAAWEAAEQNFKSLVVDFTLQVKEPICNDRQKSDGTFRMLRTAKGAVFATYELVNTNPKDEKQERTSGLLNNGIIYLLDHEKKVAVRFEPSDGDARRFLERHFNPLVSLLDRKRAEDKWKMEVKEDEWYTYLTLKAKKPTTGWLPESFQDSRIALMNKTSKGVPKNMPAQLWYVEGMNEHTFTIKTWRINGDDAPQLGEFARPEDRPGWQVGGWPFGGRTK
ncbi:MAG: hypothetical protein HY040_15380 [Planctomycetes bacterium]|nr:hypothetical protein [Planctomycetota bacterium]